MGTVGPPCGTRRSAPTDKGTTVKRSTRRVIEIGVVGAGVALLAGPARAALAQRVRDRVDPCLDSLFAFPRT